MTALLIRAAVQEDMDTVADIEERSYPNPWHPDTFRSLLKRGHVGVLVAADAEVGVVGYAVFWWVLDQAELANLAVSPEYRRRGAGAALLDQVLVDARAQGAGSVFLEVRASNESAKSLYLSRGFKQISVRKGYYQNPREDAQILVRFLGPAPGSPDGVGE